MSETVAMTYTLEDLGDKTKLTMTHTPGMAYDEQMIIGVTAGWNANWDSFDNYIPSLVG